MEHEYNNELLKTSRTKIQLGDTFASVLSFLKSKKADEETIKRIITILNEEDKARKRTTSSRDESLEKRAKVMAGVMRLAGGLIILLLGWFFLSEGLDVGRIFFIPAIAVAFGGILGLIGLLQTVILLVRKGS